MRQAGRQAAAAHREYELPSASERLCASDYAPEVGIAELITDIRKLSSEHHVLTQQAPTRCRLDGSTARQNTEPAQQRTRPCEETCRVLAHWASNPS